MKLRLDFVTNSSSSSFLVLSKREPVEKVIELVKEFALKLNPNIAKIEDFFDYSIREGKRWEVLMQNTGIDPRNRYPGFKADDKYWNQHVTEVHLPEGSGLASYGIDEWVHRSGLETTSATRIE